MGTVEDALELPPASADYPEAVDCSIAVAAAETVAAMNGKPIDDLPGEVTAFVRLANRPKESLVLAARSAVARVLKRSELREIFEESDDYNEWRASLRDLQRRLNDT
jgi:hypothetical protein